MWTKTSEPVAGRGPRLKVRRSARQFPSQQKETACVIQSWEAQGITPTWEILFVHGALSHGARHVPMFEWFIQQTGGKLRIHALDLVGHGLSGGPRAFVDKFAVFENDLMEAMRLLRAENPELPHVIMAHSLGGLISLKTLLVHESRLPFMPSALVLTNPCIRPQQVVDFPRISEVLEGFSQRLPLLRFPRVHKGRDMVGNAHAANQFETDPLVPKYMTARMVREVWYAAEDVRALSYFIKTPTLFMISAQDSVVDRQAALLFARGIDKRWVDVLEYDNAKHELLHENIRQQVWQDALAWLQKRVGGI